ncbi:hypothetical protein [Rhabdochromatium marinum]|uniref:hypothetical protein n=1 Tax=Rhabdochromatium marinum TaxID=48729 RepID=UPI0019044A0D|nr:hypothetical protein [Rhabdochromatium marinum]MBK1649641.1 hypothetical protein [Rhabdochromatium marinum]
MLNEEDVRRLYMDDIEWDRTSDSWKALIPNRNFNTFDVSDETPEEYQRRLRPRFRIPIQVLEQWLYPLYYDRTSTNNYGWLDYDKIEFVRQDMCLAQLRKVNVIRAYQRHVVEGSRYQAWHQLPCTDRDREHWIQNCTWRTPPLILDVSSITQEEIPRYADIKGRFQLVEGHSRLGYLYAADNCAVLKKEHHQAYIMRYAAS